MKLRGIQITKSSSNFIPATTWSFIFGSILRWIIGSLPVKYRRDLFKRAPEQKFVGLFLLSWRIVGHTTIFEFLGSKTRVITSNAVSIFGAEALRILSKIISEFFAKGSLRHRIWNLSFFAIGLIHFPCRLHSCSILLFEYRIGIGHEIIEIVGCSEHCNRNIIIIIVRIGQENILTASGNCSKLKGNLLNCHAVLLCRKFISGRGNVDQTPDKTRFGIGNLNRLIGPHKKEALEAVAVTRFELLIDDHALMRHQTIKSGIILNPR